MSIEQMQRYYHKRAAYYDASMGYDNPANIESLEPVIAAIKQLAKGKKVLELACGPGFWTSQISQSAESVVATDYNQSTLDQALKKNLPGEIVCFQQADAYDLNSIEGKFDMLVAVDWFAHVPLSKMTAFLQGVNQRLSKGSQVVFLDQLPRADSWTDRFDQQGNHLQLRRLENGETFDVIKHFFSDEEYINLFRNHFIDVSILRFDQCKRVMVSAKNNTYCPIKVENRSTSFR